MYPIRASLIFWIVLEWNVPSSVTLHLMLTPAENSREDQTTLKFWLLTSSRPADEVATARASRIAAVSVVKQSLTDVRIDVSFLSWWLPARWLAGVVSGRGSRSA